MRIAINGLFWDRPTTGSGQYVHALVRTMGQVAPENEYIVVLPKPPKGHVETHHPDASSRVVFHFEPVVFQQFSANIAKLDFEQRAFPLACARTRADLAHVPYFGSALIPQLTTIVTIHDLIPMLPTLPLYRGSLRVRMYTHLVARAARRAHGVITDSDCSRRDVLALLRIAPERVRAVYLAADARFKPIADNTRRATVQAKYNLPEKFLLYLGGYDQRKNVRVIIEAFALLPDLYASGYRLVLAGALLGAHSEFFPDPRRMANASELPADAIHYLDYVPEEDKPALYSSAAIFLFPSLYEGFGLPPLEAMACGTPVICSNAASLPEVVGNAARLVDPYSATTWADSIQELVNNTPLVTQMRERGLAQTRRFSWTRTARETLAIYDDVLNTMPD